MSKDIVVNLSRTSASFVRTQETNNQVDPEAQEEDSLSNSEPRQSTRTRKLSIYLKDYEVSLNVCEALLCEPNAVENSDVWDEAKKNELRSMPDMKVNKSHWILRVKDNGKRKARLVASDWDRFGMEGNVHALLANTITVDIFFESAGQNGTHIDQMDIKNYVSVWWNKRGSVHPTTVWVCERQM